MLTIFVIMAFTDDAVKAKLSALNDTQESIVTVAQWVMFHRYRHLFQPQRDLLILLSVTLDAMLNGLDRSGFKRSATRRLPSDST